MKTLINFLGWYMFYGLITVTVLAVVAFVNARLISWTSGKDQDA